MKLTRRKNQIMDQWYKIDIGLAKIYFYIFTGTIPNAQVPDKIKIYALSVDA